MVFAFATLSAHGSSSTSIQVAIVRDPTEGMRSVPRGEGIGGEARVHLRQLSAEIRQLSEDKSNRSKSKSYQGQDLFGVDE